MSDERNHPIPLSLRVSRRRRWPTSEQTAADRRLSCWTLWECSEADKMACAAYFRQRNCWDIWALVPQEQKGCCLKASSCQNCEITLTRFNDTLPVYVDVDGGARPMRPEDGSSGQAICIYLSQHYLVNGLPISPDQLNVALKKLLAEDDDREAFRCLRENARLSVGYVAAICTTHDFQRCPLLRLGASI